MTTNKTHQQLRKEWPLIDRGDGRVEIQCPHGVGHPSKLLSFMWVESWMGVLGCDGCCGSVPFRVAEESHLAAQKTHKRGG
jgi:hypothetical protein